MSDLHLDRHGGVWRKLGHDVLVRRYLDGRTGPITSQELVELRWGPLRELVPIERSSDE